MSQPKLIIFAGANGSGKTTAAEKYLKEPALFSAISGIGVSYSPTNEHWKKIVAFRDERED